MWNNYFGQIRKKYTMRVSSKTPLVINLDAKDTTKNSDINIIEEYKGGFFYTMDMAARYFSDKYQCFCIFGGDEISFVFEDVMKLVDDINSDKNTSSSEIICVFGQYFFDYFNNLYDKEKIYFHGKCFSIKNEKITSFIKYKSRLIQNLLATYFLKKNNIKNSGNIKLDEKINMCNGYVDYCKFSDRTSGILYYKGKRLDLKSFLEGNFVYLDVDNDKYSDTNANSADEIEIEF